MFATQTDSKKKASVGGKQPADVGFGAERQDNSVWQLLALNSGGIQPKLRVSEPGDPYEQEADRVADQVMSSGGARGDRAEPSESSAANYLLKRQLAPKPLPLLPTSTPLIQRDPDKKPAVVTIDNVDDLYGALTEDLAKQAFDAYGGSLTGNEKEVISAFTAQGLSGWMGLAIIKQESSFANKANNKDIDERNVANPFSVHFNTKLKAWPKDCGKNLLLKEGAGKEYKPGKDVKAECAANGFRLPTFAESAQASAKTMARLAKGKKGIDEYREEPGYKNDLNSMLRDILKKIKAKRK